MIDLSRTKSVLCFFAHPDDETLAAGGTMSKLSRLGCKVHVAIPATGIFSRRNREDLARLEPALIELRENCAVAMRHLGIHRDNIIFGEFADNEMDSVTLLTVIHWLQDVVDRVKPDLLLTHHKECTNIDHQICFEAAAVVARPGLGCNIPVLCGEVPSSTGYRRPTMFEPSLYVDISEDDLNRKIQSMQTYKGEARPDPHPRSPEVLRAVAKVRGSEGGFHWAEAFSMLRGFA